MVKPPLRTKSIGFKVSEEEYAQLETAAKSSGRTLGEWCREVILRGGSASDDPALAEIVGVRLLLVNVLRPLAAGEKLAQTGSGQILHDDTRNGFLGRPQIGMRYVLFADSIHEGRDFSMLRGYELRDGKVFRLTEDGSPSSVLVSNLSQEDKFLQTVRASAAKESPPIQSHRRVAPPLDLAGP